MSHSDNQYSLSSILAIWAAAAIPMTLLGWLATPMLGDRLDLGVGDENREMFTRGLLLTVGLIWQSVLSMFLISREEGSLSWEAIRSRCWLQRPRNPHTGRPQPRLWWWLVPLGVAAAVMQFIPFGALWEAVFPFLGEPAQYSFDTLMSSDERKQALAGAWHVLAFFIVLGAFNTVIGEELLFRGLLLPKMSGVFGARDWLANGVLFGLYHLHQPWRSSRQR